MEEVEVVKEEEIKKPLKKTTDLMKAKIDRLMANPDKPAFIPDRPKQKLPAAFRPPEFVRNVWGSSAGAGSGDFHVYRGVRRREYARQKFMNEKAKRDKLNADFLERLDEKKAKAEEKTAKKRTKRLKAKEKKKQKKNEAKMKKKENGEDGQKEKSSESESE